MSASKPHILPPFQPNPQRCLLSNNSFPIELTEVIVFGSTRVFFLHMKEILF